jgi:NADH dehydrogenase
MADRVLVLGGTGFVGRHVVARLVDAGHFVVVPTRRRSRVQDLLTLPTVDVVERDIHDRRVLDRLVAGASAVVNLVGILHERSRDEFRRVHVDLARNVVEACKANRVSRLVHMSSLGAAKDAPSRYLRSKGEAQAIVEDSGLHWTVFRPSVVFGRGDSFLSMLARLLRWTPIVFLAAPRARFQPVFVGDVAHAMAQSVDDRRTIGHAYSLCGPNVYTLRELVGWVAETTGRVRPIVPLGDALSRWQATLLELSPWKLLTRDNLASMRVDSVCDGPFPDVFGIEPAALEAIGPEYLAPTALVPRYQHYRELGGR